MKFNRIPCIILARKNSKGIKKKNIQLINGKPLILYTINYAKKSKYVNDILISTDDPDVARIATNNKCKLLYPRPKKLCTDYAGTEKALLHAINYYQKKYGKVDIFAYLQVTEPFRPNSILDECISELIKNNKIDSAFAGYVTYKNYWSYNKKFKLISSNNERYKPRQKKKIVFREDTGVALASRYRCIIKGNRIGKNIKIVPYKNITGTIDINEKNDLLLARRSAKLYLKNSKF
jgi:CMP-N-acetylneuraminic acid synthetase